MPITSVYASSVSIQALSPASAVVILGGGVTFDAATSGFTNPTYSVVDSSIGSTVSSSLINSYGNFRWIPIAQDLGTHTITVIVNDQSGNSATVSQNITVQQPPMISIQSMTPSSTMVILGKTASFSAAATGFSNPTYMVRDSFYNSSITTDSINTSGNFVWTPLLQDVGTHTITVSAGDQSGNSATALQQITVQKIPMLSIQAPSSTVIMITVGDAAIFSVEASNFTNPTYTISDSFTGSSVTPFAMNVNGNFAWRATSTKDIGTHIITVTANDSMGNTASVTQNITVSPVVVPQTATSSSLTTQVLVPTSLFPGCSSASGFSTTTGASCFSGTTTTIQQVTPALSTTNNSPTSIEVTVGPALSKNLFYGTSGADVKSLQLFLVKLGLLTATPNGTFGPQTLKAVKKFQSLHGISPTGYVGILTRAMIKSIKINL